MRVPLPTNQMQATYEDRNVAARIDEVRKAHPDIYLNLIDTHAGAFNPYVSYRFPICAVVRPLFEIKATGAAHQPENMLVTWQASERGYLSP
jgi:3-methyladenine DNA glycosylase AlkC